MFTPVEVLTYTQLPEVEVLREAELHIQYPCLPLHRES